MILTSLHEGSPNVVKEALACNVPVVSVDVGDVRERLAAAEGCSLAEAEPLDLAEKLQVTLRKNTRPHSRASVLDLSLERVAGRLSNVYAELTRHAAPP